MADVTASDSVLDSSKDVVGKGAAAKPKAGDTALQRSAKLAQKWSVELQASKKWMAKFCERARRCEKAFLDDGDGGSIAPSTRNVNSSRVNLFWSNVKVTLAAIYGRLPKASVDRKFRDFDDDVARVAANILQRILNADLDDDSDDMNPAMRDAVQDRFVSGLGQVWCRYDVETETYDAPQTDPMTGQPMTDPTTGAPMTTQQERIVNEEAEVDYVYWEDFRYSPCRRWRDVRWVARAVWMSEDRVQQRFKLTPDQLSMVPFKSRTPGGDGNETDVLKATPFKQARIWEIWDKDSNSVCWYAEGCDYVLDYAQDILQLEDFFPCPQPILATTLTKAFLPKADYIMAQDLYEELDVINNRLAALERACKAVGVRDKNAKGLEKMLTEGYENDLVPVENWSAFVEKGGLKGAVDWLPLDAFVNAITQLTQRKDVVQHDLFELLGLSDIMRGASVASETATAQQLKVQYGGARLAEMQNDVAAFVGETMRIRANIIATHFQPDTIKRLSLIDRTPDAPFADQAIAFLKQYGIAQHSITVDADSMSAPDWEQEKQVRSEFMGAVSNYIMAAAPMVQTNPAAGTFLLKLLQWGTAGFKGAAQIESVIDQAVRQFEMTAQQALSEPKDPSPEDKKNLAQAGESQAKGRKASAEATAQEQANQIIGAVMGGAGGGPPPGGMPPMPGGPGGPPGGPPDGGGPPMGPGGPGGPPGGPPGGNPMMPQVDVAQATPPAMPQPVRQ